MKTKKAIIFLVLLTVLCGCTTQTSNNTDDMLETKTYLYSYDYETEPDGELSTAYHEEKPSVNQNESRDVVKATVNDVKKQFGSHNFIATVVNGDDVKKPDIIDYSKPFVIMLGSEADGLSHEAVMTANTKTTIPMAKNTESLNLSVAGSILFYLSSQTLL